MPPSDMHAVAAAVADDEFARPRSPARLSWRKLAAFSGPGYLVAVGYMDPGNWATDFPGIPLYGDELPSVVLVANFMAMLLQALSARLRSGTRLALGQSSREHYGRRTRVALWLLCEV